MRVRYVPGTTSRRNYGGLVEAEKAGKAAGGKLAAAFMGPWSPYGVVPG